LQLGSSLIGTMFDFCACSLAKSTAKSPSIARQFRRRPSSRFSPGSFPQTFLMHALQYYNQHVSNMQAIVTRLPTSLPWPLLGPT
jgi:hypothetical protein